MYTLVCVLYSKNKREREWVGGEQQLSSLRVRARAQKKEPPFPPSLSLSQLNDQLSLNGCDGCGKRNNNNNSNFSLFLEVD